MLALFQSLWSSVSLKKKVKNYKYLRLKKAFSLVMFVSLSSWIEGSGEIREGLEYCSKREKIIENTYS
jgi:hypothetical protein